MYTEMEMMEMLNEQELLNVNGGRKMMRRRRRLNPTQLMEVACQRCGKPFSADMSAAKVMCPHCRYINTYNG